MRHPFDGIIQPETTSSRREMLKRAAAIGPALAVAALAKGAVRRKPTRRTGENPGTWGPPLTPEQKFLGYQQAFEGDLKRGDYEEAAKRLRELTSFARMKQYKPKVADAKKRLGEKLTKVLTQADADLKDGKLVEAVKAYRALSRIGGFPEQIKARKKQLVAAKQKGYKEALREVLAQELYDTACKANTAKRPALLKQIAVRYKDTPTGKKVAEELKRPPKKRRVKLIPGMTTKAIGEEGGKGRKPPPRATTLAIGEEG